MAKTKALVEETRQLEEAEKLKTNLATELVALHEQMEKARVDAVAEFYDTVPSMPEGDDTISDETIDSIRIVEQEVKEVDGVVIA
nr:hypothetical protein CFP56_59921 [Quercus suber]